LPTTCGRYSKEIIVPALLSLEFAPGQKTWLARITALGGKWGLEREFVGSIEGRPPPAAYGKLNYCLKDGVHECCEKGERSFVLIQGAVLKQLTKEQAVAHLGGVTAQEKGLSLEEQAELAKLKQNKKERENLEKLRWAESRAKQKELDDALAEKLSGLGGRIQFTSEGGFNLENDKCVDNSNDQEDVPWNSEN
jgi:hypothetical protein